MEQELPIKSYIKANYVEKKKIEEKIKELEKRLKYYESLDLPEIDGNGIRTGVIQRETIMVLRAKIKVLQELLEE